MTEKRTTVLVILDGWGMVDPKNKGNAIRPDTAPNFFRWLKQYPNSLLEASGTAVGLFKGQEGNSEAGHLNLGAGRVVKQDALYVSDAIADGTFFKNSAFLRAVEHSKKNKSSVHLMGLLSNHNSAHSRPEHLYALLDFLHQQEIGKIFLHLFTDGRDSGQHDATGHLKKLQEHFYGNEQIATIMGRFYGMDRNKNWERTEKAYNALVSGIGRQAESIEESFAQAYNSGETDEFISPTIILKNKKPVATIQDNDSIIFFNLRSDRARQLTKVFVQPHFGKENDNAFIRKKIVKNICFVAKTDFGPDLHGILTAFPSRDVVNSLTQILCPRRQLYIAESEKFAHITYFFNGGYAQHFCDESWVKIASDKIEHYEQKPEMKAHEIADYIIKVIEKGDYEFIAANFANADMVAHTGDLVATEKSIIAVDKALERIEKEVLKSGSVLLVTADHGNAESLSNLTTGEIDSEHSTSPVPCVIIGKKDITLDAGKLADVAPTILELMEIKKPKEMTGKSLIRKKF